MAGFGAILGGAMEGWSDARLDEIKAQREERMKELEAQRQDRRLADEQKFRHDEAEIGRNFDASENEKTRAATRQDRMDAREASGDLITDDKGNSYSRVGSTAKPLKDDQGNPIKVASGGKAADKPAEVSTAEWLISQGVAKTPAEAWKMVRSARADPDKSRSSIFKAWMDALTKGALGSPDPVELQKQAQEATDKTLQYLNQEGDDGQSGGAGQGGDVSNVIPSDPAKRVIGKTYTNKNGQKAIWRGNGWEPVQ